MISHYPLLETAPFMEFTSVKVTDAFNHLFDIEKNTEENLQSYCQSLINKIFQLHYSQIQNFINHHCSQTCIELKRLNLICDETQESPTRLNKKQINAESEERYFSFKEVKEELDRIIIFEEKIVYLTNQKFDYQQSVIDFVNKNLPPFDEQCTNEIERLIEVRKLEEQLTKKKTNYIQRPTLENKIKINSNLNQIVDVFFQLNRELFIEGKPYLDANTNDFVALICNNFVDKDGHEISTATVETILRPSKYDKRPKSHKRIDVNKLI
jgi:hypothetical protein